jgi:Glycosyltransferase family 87
MRAAMNPPAQRASAGAARLSDQARAGIVLLSLLVLVLAVGGWLWFLWGALHAPVGQYDFSSYYAAAAALRADRHADIYSAAVIARSGAATHVQVQPPLPYTYPPLLAIALTPLTLLPFHIAARLWLLLNAGIWLGCTAILANELRRLLRDGLVPSPSAGSPGPASAWARAVSDPVPVVALSVSAALCLPFAPARQTLLLGQINFLVLLPLALVPWLTRRGHDRWAGAAVAIAAMLKLTPALLLVYLALRRRWQALAAAIAALAALALVSVAVVGPGEFFAALPEALSVGSGDARLGHNEALLAPLLNAVASAAPGLAGPGRVAEYVVLVALAVAAGVVLWRAQRDAAVTPGTRAGEDAAYAVALCAMLLLSPATWVHHYVWVLPALALVLGLAARSFLRATTPELRRTAAAQCALLALAAVLLAVWLPYGWDTQAQPGVTTLAGLPLRPLLLESRPVGTLLVLAIAVTFALHQAGSRGHSERQGER